MRLSIPLSLLLATLAGQGVYAITLGEKTTYSSPDSTSLPAPTSTVDPDTLPEVQELTALNFRETISKGYWFIKHYSPTCGHCVLAAPIWKQVADHYTHSPVKAPNPGVQNPNPGSYGGFTDAYNFHFASINCLAYSDLCTDELNITRWPTFIIYQDGQPVETYTQPTNDFGNLSVMVNGWVDKIDEQKENRVANIPVLKEKEPNVMGHGPQGREPQKPIGPRPNPAGNSVNLDSESFQRLVLGTSDPWFIKFYAPWCTHCQAMAPAWNELGKELRTELNIGEVNCMVEKRLCQDINLRGYPTISFFKSDERVEYDGLRGFGDLVNFARKAMDSDVKIIDDAKYTELDKKGEMEVAFIYFYDHATTSEDFNALERLTLSLIGHAPLYKTNDEALANRFRVYTKPKFMVVRDGRPSYYQAITPQDNRDKKKVIGWMRDNWLPIVPELSASNSHQIMNNRIVVLGILTRQKTDEFNLARKELKEAALEYMQRRADEETAERKQLRDQKQLKLEEAEDHNDNRAVTAAKRMQINITERKKVGFAWVDGVFWERWVRRTYGVNLNEENAKIIINDEDAKLYWDATAEGQPINLSRSRILATLKDVIHRPYALRSKSTSSTVWRAYFIIKSAIHNHPLLMVTLSIAGVAGLAFWGRGQIRRKAGGYFRLDGKDRIFLGGNGQGKVD